MAANPNESANDQIADELTTHVVNILRVASDMQKPVLAELNRLEGTLAAQVAELPADISPAKAARLNALLTQTRASISDAYAKIGDSMQSGLAKVAAVEQAKTNAVVNKGIGASVMTVASTPEQLQAIASGVLLNGRFPRQWWADQDQRLRGNFEAAMRDGLARGEGVDALIRRVRGTKAANYADGIMSVPKSQAEALVRTAVQTASNQARLLSFEKNTDVIKAVQWRCLVAGTPIETPDGPRPIEQILPGEIVLGGTRNPCMVLAAARSRKTMMARVRLSSGAVIICTADHRFLTADGCWVEAKDLTPETPLAEVQPFAL